MTNSKELKEKIIRELAVKNLANAESVVGIRRDDFTSEDFQEIHWAIHENVKRHINEWRIEEVITFNGHYGGDFYGEMKKIMLLHQSADLSKYDELGSLVTDPRKMIFKETYPVEQWIEVEQALSQSQQQTQIEQPPKSNFPFGGSGGSSGSGKY